MSADSQQGAKMSLFSYLLSEVTRGYVLENDEERYTNRRQKMYTFMKIPRELEKFMSYGFFHCLDSFLFVFTFLPIRFMTALLKLLTRTPLYFLRLYRPFHGRILFPAEIIDLLKGFIIGVCVYVMSHIDTSMMYHLIKSQSVIKLYLFYNMLEVGDRLFSALGQDTIDALFWTATEPRGRKREHIGVLSHFLLTIIYVILHTLLVLLQATTLNVAINASNKALLTIMMSNNFVELKGSVFKKFDKNNLFQVSCSDVRERFHLFSLLFIVVVQTMKEYGWKEESFWNLAPDCLMVLGAEFLVDWIKHAFITRFNEVSADVYKNYTVFLAYDLAQTKQKHAFSDHSDIVSRRMGFIPIPLGVVMIRVIGTAVKSHTIGSLVTLLVAYLCLVTFRILASIVILGQACDLIDHHQESKKSGASSPQKTANAASEGASQQSPKDAAEDLEVEVMTSGLGRKLGGSFASMSSEAAAGLLEAKLELLQTAAVVRSTPPLHVLPSKLSEDNLDPIEEEKPLESISASAAPSGHIWSNRRSQLLLKQHQGELNRVVFSDSRRRPLSCTPPSTSISTSVSIDEPEDEPSFSAINSVNKDNMMSFVVAAAATSISPESAGSCHDQVVNNEAVEAVDDEDAASLSPSMKAKSLSSPDFMKSFKAAYDEERDWPEIEDELDEVDNSRHDENSGLDEDDDAGVGASQKGSDASVDKLRRRKRLDSSVV